MNYREFPPSPAIRSIVDRYWSAESESVFDAPPEPVLPDGRGDASIVRTVDEHRALGELSDFYKTTY